MLVIAGEKGVGKTRLLAHVGARLLLDGARVVRWDGQGSSERLAALLALSAGEASASVEPERADAATTSRRRARVASEAPAPAATRC